MAASRPSSLLPTELMEQELGEVIKIEDKQLTDGIGIAKRVLSARLPMVRSLIGIRGQHARVAVLGNRRSRQRAPRAGIHTTDEAAASYAVRSYRI